MSNWFIPILTSMQIALACGMEMSTENASSPRSGTLWVAFFGTLIQNEIHLFGTQNNFLDFACNYRMVMPIILCDYCILAYIHMCVFVYISLIIKLIMMHLSPC